MRLWSLSRDMLAKIKYGASPAAQNQAICDVMYESFFASDGEAEAGQVSRLAQEVLSAKDGCAYAAWHDEVMVAAIIFSKISFGDPKQSMRLLSPVAVAPKAQGIGVGTALIEHGLNQLRSNGVKAVFTYGDPAYYGRFGFRGISADVARPPHPLKFAQGWQVLTWGAHTPRFEGIAQVVAAMDDAAIW